MCTKHCCLIKSLKTTKKYRQLQNTWNTTLTLTFSLTSFRAVFLFLFLKKENITHTNSKGPFMPPQTPFPSLHPPLSSCVVFCLPRSLNFYCPICMHMNTDITIMSVLQFTSMIKSRYCSVTYFSYPRTCFKNVPRLYL